MNKHFHKKVNFDDRLSEWLNSNKDSETFLIREVILKLLLNHNLSVHVTHHSLNQVEKLGYRWALSIDLNNQKVYFPSLTRIKQPSDHVLNIEYQLGAFLIRYQTQEKVRYFFKLLETEHQMCIDVQNGASRLSQFLLRRTGNYDLYNSFICKEILCLISNLMDLEETKEEKMYLKSNHFFLKLHLEISTRLSGQCSTQDLAKKMGYSVQHLNRLCREFINMTVKEYTVLRKLEKSRSLLTQSSIQIKDIALQCGFKDAEHYIKTFRLKYNITPKKFRLSFKNDQLDASERLSLHQTNDLSELDIFYDEEQCISEFEESKKHFFMMTNLLDEDIICSWVDALGHVEEKWMIVPNQRIYCGSSKGQCWKIHDMSGRFLCATITVDHPCIAFVRDDCDNGSH